MGIRHTGAIGARIPEADDKTGTDDFRREADDTRVPLQPAESKTQGWVNEAFREMNIYQR